MAENQADKAKKTAEKPAKKNIDEKFMRAAIKEAFKAAAKGEIPVGAVVVFDGKIVARGHNLRIKNYDATAHAEVVAIKKAGKKLKRWNLTDCDLYVTLEPCAMCGGAAVNARIRRVIFGAYDHRFGCCGTLVNIAAFEKLNHRSEVIGGVLENECAGILKNYFKKMRNKSPDKTEPL